MGRTWTAFPWTTAMVLCVCLLDAGPAAAQDASGLFTCRVIVTGTDLRERPAGLERCVRAVVVKVTGMPQLADDPRAFAIAGRAAGLVEDIVYLDRMTDLPRHDEQGTRDRPFDLVAHVDPEKLRAELASVGLKPWLDRPTLLASVQVSTGAERFRLTADGLAGERQRRALLAAGETYGLRVALLTERQTEALAGGAPGPRDGDAGRWDRPGDRPERDVDLERRGFRLERRVAHVARRCGAGLGHPRGVVRRGVPQRGGRGGRGALGAGVAGHGWSIDACGIEARRRKMRSSLRMNRSRFANS